MAKRSILTKLFSCSFLNRVLMVQEELQLGLLKSRKKQSLFTDRVSFLNMKIVMLFSS